MKFRKRTYIYLVAIILIVSFFFLLFQPYKKERLHLVEYWSPSYKKILSVNNPVKWNMSELKNHCFDLIDKEEVETYCFDTDGYISAVFGAEDGLLTAPILLWEIDNNGDLIIKEEPNKVLEKMKKLGQVKNHYKVINNFGHEKLFYRWRWKD